MKVLIVDDEPNILLSLEFLMKKEGYRVFIARDGTEAVTLFAARSKEIPLVITDLNMPNLAGPALAGIVRRFNPAVKIIAMSGVAFDDEGARSDPPLIDRLCPWCSVFHHFTEKWMIGMLTAPTSPKIAARRPSGPRSCSAAASAM